LDTPSLIRSGTANYDVKRFKTLTTLSVGVSQIEDEGAVALFLSRLCPLGCEIECGAVWNSTLQDHTNVDGGNAGSTTGLVPEELLREVTERCTKWNEVRRMLPFLTRSRIEERESCKALANEVEDLRIRNRILMGKGNKTVDEDEI
jgi:hypothetical protein